MNNSCKHQIHQIIHITINNGKTEYRGRTYAKNDIALEPGWISDDLELREQELYKLVKTITRDDDSPNIYNVPVGRCDLHTSVDEYKYEEIHQNELICPGEYIYIKEPIKISEKKIIHLYIVPGAPTLIYQQGNHNSCIVSSLA